MADAIAPPRLTHLADIAIEVGAPVVVSDQAGRLRRIMPITGGRLTGQG